MRCVAQGDQSVDRSQTTKLDNDLQEELYVSEDARERLVQMLQVRHTNGITLTLTNASRFSAWWTICTRMSPPCPGTMCIDGSVSASCHNCTQNDSEFLQRHDIMDYSALLGIKMQVSDATSAVQSRCRRCSFVVSSLLPPCVCVIALPRCRPVPLPRSS